MNKSVKRTRQSQKQTISVNQSCVDNSAAVSWSCKWENRDPSALTPYTKWFLTNTELNRNGSSSKPSRAERKTVVTDAEKQRFLKRGAEDANQSFHRVI